MFVSAEDHLVELMVEAGVIQVDGYYKLKLHETDPTAPLSPFYLDLRRVTTSTNGLWQQLTWTLRQFVDGLAIECDDHHSQFCYRSVAPIPQAGLPLFAPFAHDQRHPLLNVRNVAKTHGITGNLIDGEYKEGDHVLVMDDLLTKAGKLEFCRKLEEHGLVVAAVVTIVDREQGGRERLEEAGYKFFTLMTASELLASAKKMGKISDDKYSEIMTYLGLG